RSNPHDGFRGRLRRRARAADSADDAAGGMCPRIGKSLLALGLSAMSSRRRSGRDVRFIARPPPRSLRAPFPPAYHAIFVVLCCFILLFAPRREHSSVPTAYDRRVAHSDGQGRRFFSAARRLVLDRREHGGSRDRVVYHAMIRGGACHWPRAIAREPRLYSVEPI